MFEVKKNEGLEGYQIASEYALFYNGEPINNILVQKDEDSLKELFEIETLFEHETNFLMEFNFDDFRFFTSHLTLKDWIIEQNFKWSIEITFNYRPRVKFNLLTDFENYKNPFSFAEYKNTFKQIIVDKYSANFSPGYFADIPFDFSILEFPAIGNFGNNSIKIEVDEHKNLLVKIHKETLNLLNNRVLGNSIYISVDFPEEIKTSCQQYPLYFAQFLKDLGICATSNLKEEAGKVLFSVTPTDDIEALDKIREALAVYLNLPSSPIVYDESFAAMRLHQQIDNLQHSQRMKEMEMRSTQYAFRLAQQTIENQDIIISQQNSLIDNQNKIIDKITSKSIMIDSLENKAEFEKLFDGLEFGESKELKEKLGIKFKPVTFLQSLGRTISRSDDEITSLNLNETLEEKDN